MSKLVTSPFVLALSILPACQTLDSVPPERVPSGTMVEGPVDGASPIRFVYPQVLEPRITAVGPDEEPTQGGSMLRDVLGLRASSRVAHDTVGPNDFSVRLSGAESAAVLQEGDERCWAACVLMVSRVCGFSLVSGRTGAPPSQEELSRRLNGTSKDAPADLGVIVRALNPQLEAMLQDQVVTIGAPFVVQSTDRLLMDLCAGDPAIIGLDMGDFFHAVVVIGARYGWRPGGEKAARLKLQLNGASKELNALVGDWGAYVDDVANLVNLLAIREVTIIDPADGAVRTLSGADLVTRCRFIMTPRLAAEVLTQPKNVDPTRWMEPNQHVPSGFDATKTSWTRGPLDSIGTVFGAIRP